MKEGEDRLQRQLELNAKEIARLRTQQPQQTRHVVRRKSSKTGDSPDARLGIEVFAHDPLAISAYILSSVESYFVPMSSPIQSVRGGRAQAAAVVNGDSHAGFWETQVCSR